MQKLQAGIYIATIIIILIVVLIFWGVIPGLKTNRVSVRMVVWGTLPPQALQESIQQYTNDNRTIRITYVKKDPASFEGELVNAIATGKGPDMWILPNNLVSRQIDKISPMPPTLMTEREFIETFADVAADSFFQKGAIIGLPLYIDPLVLYWNKDFLASEGLAVPPKTWDEFLSYTQKITKRAPDETITRGGTAMGLATNIPEAKDIISLLIMQGGTKIVDPKTHATTLGESHLVGSIQVSPTESALRFYTDFARRSKNSYTWNTTFPDPVTSFGREQIAMFVGYASNYEKIKKVNPHLAVSVSPVPQYAGAQYNLSYGRAEAMTVSLASRNKVAAWQFIKYLTSEVKGTNIPNSLKLAPVRRDLLQRGHENPVFSVMYESALKARAWYDPDPMRTQQIFQNMIESTLTGTTISSASSEAARRLSELVRISK